MAGVALGEAASRLRRHGEWRWRALVFVAAVAGLALRVWVHASALGIPDSDEAIVGLMARHVLDGELAVFFWGQPFGGSQETLVTAPVFALVSSGWITLRLVPVALSAVAALVVWRVGRRTVGEPAATVAGCAAWIFPPFLVYKLTHQHGFYASGVLYAALILLLALRLVAGPTLGRAVAFGLVAGLGLWQSAQLLPIVLAATAWTVWRRPAWLRFAPAAAAAAFVGALPALVWNVEHGWASLDSPIENTTSYAHRLRIFLSPLLPMLLGLRTPLTQETPLPAPALLLVLAALAALFVAAAIRSRSRPASLLYLTAAVFPFVYAVAPQTLLSHEPRYLVVASPIVVLLLASLGTSFRRACVVLAVLLTVSIVTLERMETHLETVPTRPPAAPRDLGPLVTVLDELGLDRVYADFWVAYRLTFDTDERIVAAQNKLERVGVVDGRVIASRHPSIRHRPYEREVEAARHGFVFFRTSILTGADRSPGAPARRRSRQLRALVAELRGYGYRRVPVGPFEVYAPPE